MPYVPCFQCRRGVKTGAGHQKQDLEEKTFRVKLELVWSTATFGSQRESNEEYGSQI